MAKRISYNGSTHSFPDDATDDEITEALGGASSPSTPPMPKAPYQTLQMQEDSGPTSANESFRQSLGSAIGVPEKVSDYISGPKYAVKHPVDSAKLLGKSAIESQHAPADAAVSEWRAGHIPAAIADAIYSGIPLVGPLMSKAGHQLQEGDIAGGAGSMVGLAAPLVADKVPGAISEAMKTVPTGAVARANLAKNIVSPMVYEGVGEAANDARFGVDPARGLANEGLVGSKESLAGNVAERTPGKIDARLSELKSSADNILKNHPNSRLHINAEPAIDSAIDAAVKSAKDVGSEGTVNRLESLRNALKTRYGKMQGTPYELNELKTRLQNAANELGGYKNAEPADASAANAAKSAAQNIRQMVDKAIPEAAELNSRMADLIDAKAGLARKVNLAKGEDIFGGRPGTHGGMVSRALQRTIGSAPVRTRIARALNAGNIKPVPAPTAYVPPQIAGLLGPAPTELGSAMEPIGEASTPQPTLPYQPSLQRPPAFVTPGEISPAQGPQGLLFPSELQDFREGIRPGQQNLFQTPVEKGFKQTPVSGGAPSVPEPISSIFEGNPMDKPMGGRGGLPVNPSPEAMAKRPSAIPTPDYEYKPEGVKQDTGEAVRSEKPPMPRGEKRSRVRTADENATTDAWKQARKELGDEAPSEAIEARVDEIKRKKSGK